MSALKGKKDSSTSGVTENITAPDKSPLAKDTDDAENTTKSLEVGGGDTGRDKNDDDLQTPLREKDEEITKNDGAVIKDSPLNSSPYIDELLSQENVPKDNTPNVELENSTFQLDNDKNQSDELSDSCEDLELKWEDDEKDEDCPTNLSEEALKSLDKELGIEGKLAEIETNRENPSDTNKESMNIETTEGKCNKMIGEDSKHEIEEDASSKTDAELICSNNDIIKDDLDSQKSEGSMEINTDATNIATTSATSIVEEMDVNLITNDNKLKVFDTPVEIIEQSDLLEQENSIKTDAEIAIAVNDDCTDIEMTETTDQSLPEINSLEQIKVNLETESGPNVSSQEIATDEVIADENVESTEIKDNTTKLNKKVTKGMKTDLGLNKPDVMLEIPTQELIDIDDFDDSSELDKEMFDSEIKDTLNNISTSETNVEDNKLTIGQPNSATLPEDKDMTVTELVKMATEEKKSIETEDNLDKNNTPDTDMLIMSNEIPVSSNKSAIEDISKNNDQIFPDESSSKASDDNIEQNDKVDNNLITNLATKTVHSEVAVEPASKSDDATAPTVNPIPEPSEDSMTDDQTSKVSDTHTTKETPDLDNNLKADVAEDTVNTTENVTKADDNNTIEDASEKDKAAEQISKPNEGDMTECDETCKIPKESCNNETKTPEKNKPEEASNQNLETPELAENAATKPVSDTNEYNLPKEPEDESTTTKCDDEPETAKAGTSHPDDEGLEMSDSLGLLAESSRVMDDDDDSDDFDRDQDHEQDHDQHDLDHDLLPELDIDPDDESSNLPTAEQSEESNPPSDEPQTDDKDGAASDDNVAEDDGICDKDTKAGILDDIVCEEIVKSATQGDEVSPEEIQVKQEKPDTSKKEEDGCVLRELLLRDQEKADESPTSPSKSMRLTMSSTNQASVMTYVDLGESSDDEQQGTLKEERKEPVDDSDDKVLDETKPKSSFKMTKLNTSEVTIKTGGSTKPPLIIPEITNVSEIESRRDSVVSVDNKQSLEEIFNIDSDSDDEEPKKPKQKAVQPKTNPKCINPMCSSPCTDQHYVADAAAMRHYGATKRRAVCAPCLASVDSWNEALVKGIKDQTPLFDLNMEKPTNQLVEISDSDSEDESDVIKECKEFIGQDGAKMLNEKLGDLINDVWNKFNMDDRLKDSENYINGELKRLEDEGIEINKILNECQSETDKLRNDLYNSFECSSKSLPPFLIHDTPGIDYACLEKDDNNKQRYVSPYLMENFKEPPTKRQNLGQNTTADVPSTVVSAGDDELSVVLLSAEAAPADLPPQGEVVRPALRPGLPVHAMRNAFGSWLRGRLLDVLPRQPGQQYTQCRVKFDHNVKNPSKVLPARCIAFQEPCNVRMTIGTRVLALFRDVNRKESFYSGVVAEAPNPVNSYRYLVFFDDGYAQYVKHNDTRLVCESKSLVWEEVHPFIREFVKDYLLKYPERPMVRLHAGQKLNTEWNGEWWVSKVLKVDASLAHVHFEKDNRTEWIYRGSTRLAPLYLELQAAGRTRTRLPRSKAQFRTNMPYVEYMRSEEQTKQQQQLQQDAIQQEEMTRRQRSVAKKSVSLPQPAPMVDKPDNVTSRVVYYTPKNAVKPHKMVAHTCGPQCRRTDVLSLKELRTYNPLAKPLLSGWERMQVRFKGSKHIMYRAPCGRRLRDMRELHRYLRAVEADLPVDLFDFNVNTHCLAEFVLHKYNVMKKDLSHGKESVPVPCVNYYDESLPEFCSYNTERTATAGVPLNIDPGFLCGCDCEDDCEDKSKCACWQMTLEGARTIGLDSNVGYVYRRLPEPLPSGIYECNSRCKCKSTCLNRVAQHPLQLKLQVFKTLKRGWGIRALNDVPKGSFLCVYAGNLLTDATANLDGLNEGDEYLAELDYIEVVEQMKEGFEEDIPEADKKLDKKESKQSSSEEETESEEDNRDSDKNDKEDDDFQPGYIGLGLTEFNKRLRKRGRKKQNEGKEDGKETEDKKTDDCITISDDEEVREPSRFTAQAGMGDKGFVSKYRSVRSLFGKDEACYIMDAKVQGNIGRYLNHSCCPNVFVQNVFVDTHDPRFPWVAFFALSHIRAGTELTWNYNYDIGSVPGKILYCYCSAHNCRGRLL